MTAAGVPIEATALDPDYTYIRDLVRERSAIVLEPSKAYLIESRLTPLARSEGVGTLQQLIVRLRGDRNGALERKVVEAMTTNETSFFRDRHPFDALRQTILPEIRSNREASKVLSIWSAACSTGQEAYTIAMVIHEHFPDLVASWKVRILGTDLSGQVVERARRGAFSQLEINRGLPAALSVKYFRREGLEWLAREPLKQMTEFREMNLVEPWPSLPPMDLVFLRNVLIYFDTETKKAILKRVRSVLRPDGILFLGGAETTLNIDEAFERVPLDKVGGCYRPRRA
jgi:chemotaxis protein methyltransferase CheR